jgi:hypothetical protein
MHTLRQSSFSPNNNSSLSTESNCIIVDQDKKNTTGAPAGEVDPAQEPRNYFHHPLVSTSALEQIGIRPWSEFFQRKNLALPKNFEDTKSRIQRNSSHLYANYVLVVLVFAAIALMSQPLLLLGLIVAVQMFRWVESMEQIKLWGSLKIEGRLKTIGIRVLSGIALVALTIDSFVIVTGIASLIIFLHAILINAVPKERKRHCCCSCCGAPDP